MIPLQKKIKKKTVLVIIPTLGERIDMLTNCLNSVFLNDCDLRVVVVFPTKNYEKILEIKKIFPAVILEKQDLKLIPAVNYVIRKNDDCKYFTWINDDDMLINNCIPRSLYVLEKNLEIVATYGAVEYIDQHGIVISRWNPPRFAHLVNFFIPSAVKAEGTLFRMSFIKIIGEIPSYVNVSVGDVYLITRAKQIGKIRKIDGQAVAQFRIHSDSPTTNNKYRINFEAFKLQLRLGSNFQRVFILLFGPIFIFTKILILRMMFSKFYSEV